MLRRCARLARSLNDRLVLSRFGRATTASFTSASMHTPVATAAQRLESRLTGGRQAHINAAGGFAALGRGKHDREPYRWKGGGSRRPEALICVNGGSPRCRRRSPGIEEDTSMTSIRTCCSAALLLASLAGSAAAATAGNDASRNSGQAVTTTPTSPLMSSPNTSSHDGNNRLGSNAARDDNPGAAASPHTGYSSGMAPNAGTGSGTADGTTDTGATSPGSGKAYGSSAAQSRSSPQR